MKLQPWVNGIVSETWHFTVKVKINSYGNGKEDL